MDRSSPSVKSSASPASRPAGRRGLARPVAFAALATFAALGLSLGARPLRRQSPRTPRATPVPAVTSLALPPASARLAFVRDGNIWTAAGDGSGQRLVIRRGEAPCWSPDHRQLAFAREGNIWLANADGSDQRQLTAFRDGNSTNGWALSWDPV